MGMLSQLFFEPSAGQTRGWRHAMSNEPSWRPAQPIEPVRIGQQAAQGLGVTRRFTRGATSRTVTVSALGHVLALVAVALFAQSHTNDAGNEPTGVQLIFEPAPASPVESQTAVAVPVALPPELQAAVPAVTAAAPPPPAAEIPAPRPVPQSVAAAEPAAVALPLPPLPPTEPPAPAKPRLVARPTPERMIAARSQSEAPPTTQSMIAGSLSFGGAAQIIPPRPVAGMDTNRAPVYPELSRRRGEQGRVLLRVNVSTDGMPLEVAIVDTSGHPGLDAAALTAIRQWRFVPAMQAGRPVPAEADVPIRFRLDN